MHELIDYLGDELKSHEKKVGNGHNLSNSEIERGKIISEFKTNLLTCKAMEESGYSEEYRDGMSRADRMSRRSGMSYDEDMSYARGRSGNVRRDNIGRFSNDGMSYDDAREDLMVQIREYMKSAPDDEKHEARRFLNTLKNG